MKHLVSILAMGVLTLTGCTGCKEKNIADTPFAATTFDVSHFRTDKTAYGVGETISCEFKMENNTENEVSVREVSVKITNLSDPAAPVIYTKTILTDRINLKAASAQTFTVSNMFVVPADAHIGDSYGINLSFNFEEGMSRDIKASFIRIADEQTLMVYSIDRKTTYNGLDIFALDGGMSPEFAVENSLASFAFGISYIRNSPANGGAKPVLMTPDFMSRSVKKTVEMYNDILGENTPVKNVIIGTGVVAASYLAASLQAVFLPIHFLGAAQTAQEMQLALNHANETGYPSYATFGYDGSMPDYGVAWHKLLDLPEEYRQFLIDHQVENVILFGIGEKIFAESYACKVATDYSTGEYGPGSLYMLYTQFASDADIAALTSRIFDFKTLNLKPAQLIADWESGILDKQITQFAKTIHEKTAANVYSVSCPSDMIALYNLATNLYVYSIYKNRDVLPSPQIKGVVLNEYLAYQPQYEMMKGDIPLLYWQFTATSSHLERVTSVAKAAIEARFPSVTFNDLNFVLNSRLGKEDLKAGLIAQGVPEANITSRGVPFEEWNPSNGMSAPSELAAEDIVNNIGVANYKAALQPIVPLTMTELATVCSETSGGAVFQEQ